MELSFGEQIKIILKRNNMTIQDLATLYEERTGSKMSRQNLTQRLKRDNFPEQDMHVIAALLGYQVSVQLTPVTVPMPGFIQPNAAASMSPVFTAPVTVPPSSTQTPAAPVQTPAPTVPVQAAPPQPMPASSEQFSPRPESETSSAANSGMSFNIPEAFRRARPQGDINPLTGEEYLTNTVRRHPEIEEYVQVYDQTTHEWNDVREDYFWEFQEKKKQMMGNDYRAPIMI